jgi:hypothetical protein
MDFVDKLDTLYNTHLIYRTIVVCDGDICEYKRLLEKRDFSVYLTEADADINYDTLDCRVILIESKRIEDFLNNVISKKINNFYTFITFTNDNDDAKDAITKRYSDNPDIINNIV